jgi:hypothetical protein
MAFLLPMLAIRGVKGVVKGVRKQFSHDERDEQLAALHDQAVSDAQCAEAAGDMQAAQYYRQQSRRYGLQRLQEAEHKAQLEVQTAQKAGKKKAIKAAQQKVQDIRDRMATEYGVQSDQTGLDGLPPIERYQPYQHQPVPQGQAVAAQANGPAPPPYFATS